LSEPGARPSFPATSSTLIDAPMHIFREPRVTVLARQEFTVPSHIKWHSDSEVAGEALAEFAGRLCYLSFGEDAGLEGGHKTIPGRTTNQAYLANILNTKHGSVLEHAVWSLLFEGVSRTLTHELVRHRAGFGFSQLSQRYVDESNIGFVLPPEIDEGTPAFDIWAQACESSLGSYRALLATMTDQVSESGTATMRKKRARQAARAVLLNCAETKIVVTGNARAWRHFCEMRGSPTAEIEIRKLAVEVLQTLQAEAPHIFSDMRFVEHEDGVPVIETDHGKV